MVYISGGGSIDDDNNYLEKPSEALQINGTISEVQSSRKELAERELQMPNGNKEGITRVIHFQESVHVDIPK